MNRGEASDLKHNQALWDFLEETEKGLISEWFSSGTVEGRERLHAKVDAIRTLGKSLEDRIEEILSGESRDSSDG